MVYGFSVPSSSKGPRVFVFDGPEDVQIQVLPGRSENGVNNEYNLVDQVGSKFSLPVGFP